MNGNGLVHIFNLRPHKPPNKGCLRWLLIANPNIMAFLVCLVFSFPYVVIFTQLHFRAEQHQRPNRITLKTIPMAKKNKTKQPPTTLQQMAFGVSSEQKRPRGTVTGHPWQHPGNHTGKSPCGVSREEGLKKSRRGSEAKLEGVYSFIDVFIYLF